MSQMRLTCPQNIDEIFADIHNVIIGQLLPSIKEYSRSTQPTREAARVRVFTDRVPQKLLTLSCTSSGRISLKWQQTSR